MLAYLDSSALVKRYVSEPGTHVINRLFTGDRTLLTSSIAWSECLAALARRRHEGGLSDRSYARAREAFATEWKSLNELGLTREIQQQIHDLLSRTPLRGMDAIHLASAAWAERSIGGPLAFYCSDRKLASAARDLGLAVTDPEKASPGL